jgi:phosphoribosyl 1,2-cyclic phosphate phosphodiesterase
MSAQAPLHVRFLGTGTSQGVPVIGCDCPVCRSDDPRDMRLRCSLLVRRGDTTLVIDSGPDFRQQMLLAGVQELHGVVFTHEHNDHIIGLDDVRPFNFRQRFDMPIYAHPRVCEELQQRFAYVFSPNPYPGVPRVALQPIGKEQPFEVGSIRLQPVEYFHGRLPVLGFRIGNLAYLTDFKSIHPDEFEKLLGVECLIVSALHHQPHHSHMNLEEALEFIETLAPERAYLIHMSHYMGLHEVQQQRLPEGVFMAYDGLEIQC